MSRPLGPCPGSAGKAALRPGKGWAFLTEADVHPELPDQSLANHQPHPPLIQGLLGHTTSRSPCWSSSQMGLGGTLHVGGGMPSSLAWAGGEGLLLATLSFLVGSPAWRCKELPSTLALSLSPACGQQGAGHTGPQLCSGGHLLCLPASQLERSWAHSLQESCQPPGQTGLAGCLLAGGAVTQLLPGPGQTALRSAKLQSEDLNQAKPHPAKWRTVLGAGGGRLPPPQVLSHSGVWRLEGAPPRGASGGRGSARACGHFLTRRTVSRSLGSGRCSLCADFQGLLSAVPLSKVVSCPSCEGSEVRKDLCHHRGDIILPKYFLEETSARRASKLLL